MKFFSRIVGVALFLLLCGCVPSLYPLYTPADLTFAPELVGTWTGEKEKETWVFKKEDDNAYAATLTESDGKKGNFKVHLVKIEEHLFLDIYPETPEIDANSFYIWHLRPVHTFMKVEQLAPTLKVATLDLDWCTKYLKENPTAISHEITDDTILLTAKPKELQAFLLKHLNTEGAWEQSPPMTKQAAEAQ